MVTTDLIRSWKEKKRKLGPYAMMRVTAGAHLPIPWLFEPAKRPNDTAEYCLDRSASIWYSFSQLSGLGGAPYGRTLVRARPHEHSQRTEQPSNVDWFPCLREKARSKLTVHIRHGHISKYHINRTQFIMHIQILPDYPMYFPKYMHPTPIDRRNIIFRLHTQSFCV